MATSGNSSALTGVLSAKQVQELLLSEGEGAVCRPRPSPSLTSSPWHGSPGDHPREEHGDPAPAPDQQGPRDAISAWAEPADGLPLMGLSPEPGGQRAAQRKCGLSTGIRVWRRMTVTREALPSACGAGPDGSSEEGAPVCADARTRRRRSAGGGGACEAGRQPTWSRGGASARPASEPLDSPLTERPFTGSPPTTTELTPREGLMQTWEEESFRPGPWEAASGEHQCRCLQLCKRPLL
ncbi:hypothetical protein AAFF_G00083520 [Aldrovandia affinis]|uniref:Uncharacterized protein n=1 Tax=Aldrovandia affinis TaxID=143900 RepID=A0AAD7VXD8_9TELE|nr:hypothetical protein AAFF_G00083520 [Aldrovandia affinis]